MNIPDEAVEAAWKVMEPRFLGMNRERSRDSLILALDAALPHILTHRAEAVRAAATPHLRAGMADEILDDTPGSPLTRGYQRLMDPKPGEHPVRTWEAAVRVMLDTLLEGGAE